jgi:hypothetical protein
MASRALCVGSAACVGDDLAAAAALGVSQADGWTVIACNHMARDWPRAFDHWVTFHPELLPRWTADRQAQGRPTCASLWTVDNRVVPGGFMMPVQRAANWGGSSGLLMATVALLLGADKIVLAGVPLDYEQGHYDSPDKAWREAGSYRKGWTSHQDDLVNVRSLSGWTAGLLGTPTREWLAAAPVPRDDSSTAVRRRQGGRR